MRIPEQRDGSEKVNGKLGTLASRLKAGKERERSETTCKEPNSTLHSRNETSLRDDT